MNAARPAGAGHTLVEVAAAMGILLVSLMGLGALVGTTSAGARSTDETEVARPPPS